MRVNGSPHTFVYPATPFVIPAKAGIQKGGEGGGPALAPPALAPAGDKPAALHWLRESCGG